MRITPPWSSIRRARAWASLSLPPSAVAMPPPMRAASVNGTQKPLLAPSGVRPRWSTQGAMRARSTRERKRAVSTSRAGSRNSEANGDGPVPSALTIRRRRNGAASGEVRSSPKSGKISPA